ncbi:MAG: tol-pal system YbgF family protein [bacterium]
MRLRGKNRLSLAKCSYLLILLLAWGVAACGGSKKQSSPSEGDDINIDQLLGIESENTQNQQAESTPPAEKSKDEDEVLKLLGITTDEKKGGEAEQQTAEPPSEAQQLKDEVNRLQTELFEKDNTIDELKRELNEKNERLVALQTTGLTSSRLPQTTPANGMRSFSGVTGKDRYNQALASYNSGKYKEAIDQFSALLNDNIEASLADNCQYWIGESYYGLRNYSQAVAEFEKVFRFSDSNKADDALLKLGITYMRLKDKNSARTQFQLLLENYTDSEFVERARKYISNL